MSADHVVSFSLEVNIEEAFEEVRKFQMILFRSLSLIRRMSGDEDINKFISGIQRLIVLLNKLRLTLRAVQLLRMAAGDPLSWATAGLTVVELGADIGMELGSR